MVSSKQDSREIAIGWLVIVRMLTGGYWLYFGAQKWFGHAGYEKH